MVKARSNLGPLQPVSLRVRGIQLLSQREHSAEELRRKLMRHARDDATRVASAVEGDQSEPDSAECDNSGDNSGDNSANARVEDALAWLTAQGYLDNERFVESRVHVRAARFGNLRIRAELAQHGLALTPEAAQALKDTELNRAQDVWLRKFGPNAERDAPAQLRQTRFLAQRGFSSEVIRRVLRSARADASHDEADPSA